MKYLLTSLSILILFAGCNQHPKNKAAIKQIQTKKEEKTAATSDKKDSVPGNLEFLGRAGIGITDTINVDSLKKVASIKSSIIFKHQIYVTYAVQSVGKSYHGEPVADFGGQFLAKLSTERLPAPQFTDIDFDKLKTSGTAYKLGDEYTIGYYSDPIYLTRLKVIPDSALYLYASFPLYGQTSYHVVLKQEDEDFKKLFDLESDDSFLNFKLNSDSILEAPCAYETADGIEFDTVKYDIRNEKRIN